LEDIYFTLFFVLQVLSLQHLEESLHPTIELSRLLKEGKLEEAFNKALSLSDVAVVSWLCMQVHISAIVSVINLRGKGL